MWVRISRGQFNRSSQGLLTAVPVAAGFERAPELRPETIIVRRQSHRLLVFAYGRSHILCTEFFLFECTEPPMRQRISGSPAHRHPSQIDPTLSNVGRILGNGIANVPAYRKPGAQDREQ